MSLHTLFCCLRAYVAQVKVMVQFKGREMQHRDLGFKLLMSIQEKLVDKAAVEQAPMPDRNRLVMTLIPKPH